jgi:hypothetical protein
LAPADKTIVRFVMVLIVSDNRTLAGAKSPLIDHRAFKIYEQIRARPMDRNASWCPIDVAVASEPIEQREVNEIPHTSLLRIA